MDFVKYVENKKKEARLRNIKELRAQIDEPWVREKIINHITFFEGLMSYEDVRQGILDNIIIASKFCKDPSKQNISEKAAIELLGVEKLPQAGARSIRFNDSGDIVHTAQGNTKSADFKLNEYFATQKYTNETGGAQDNQRNDVIDFLKRGSIKNKVAAVVDGPYWDKHWRAELAKMFADNSNVLITSVAELVQE